jgi:hypothetical protein
VSQLPSLHAVQVRLEGSGDGQGAGKGWADMVASP